MLSLYLWRAFYDSLPRHPLFWKTLDKGARSSVIRQGWRWRLRQFGAILLGLLLFLLLWWIILPAFVLVYVVVLAGALIVGTSAAAGVSGTIAHEHEQRRYDLVALSPSGMFGMAWALGTRYLRTSPNIVRLTRFIRAFHGLCAAFAIMIVVLGWLVAISLGDAAGFIESGLPSMISGLVFVAALHLDFVQAVLIGAVVGILVPTFSRKRVDSSLAAVGLFLIVKIACYLVIYLAASLIGAALTAMGVIDISIPVVLLSPVLVFLTHEIALRLLWQSAEQALNLDRGELQSLKRFG